MKNPNIIRLALRICFLAVALLVSAQRSGAQDDAKKEMAQLEGKWSMVSGEANGMAMPKAMASTGKRVAKDGETTISMGGRLYFKAKFSIDSTKKPKSIDYVMIEGPTKGKTQLGIYELDGDTLKFCFAAPGSDRPTEFSSKEGSQQTLSVWKRDKK
jgi:uncharacterized protein (TIGR03067 family)